MDGEIEMQKSMPQSKATKRELLLDAIDEADEHADCTDEKVKFSFKFYSNKIIFQQLNFFPLN